MTTAIAIDRVVLGAVEAMEGNLEVIDLEAGKRTRPERRRAKWETGRLA